MVNFYYIHLIKATPIYGNLLQFTSTRSVDLNQREQLSM